MTKGVTKWIESKKERVLEEFLDYASVEESLATSTIAAYGGDLKQYIRYLDNTKVGSIERVSEEHIRNFARMLLLKEGLAAKSVARKLTSIRRFHRFAAMRGYTNGDPARGVRMPRWWMKVPCILSVREMGRVLSQALHDCPLGIRDKAMLEFLYATGVKVSELLKIRTGDVVQSARMLRVFGRVRSQRLIPLGERAGGWVEKYMEEVRPGLAEGYLGDVLFLNRRGRPFTRMGVWKILRRYVEEAGIRKKVSPHTIRHSFAAHRLEGGASVAWLQSILGHKHLCTTEIYAELYREYSKGDEGSEDGRKKGRNCEAGKE